MRLAAITLDEVRAILAQAAPSARPVAVARMTGGESGGANLVTLADDPGQVVVKTYSSAWILAKEVAAYRLMRSNGITLIPALLGGSVAKDSATGRPYLLMSKLPGVAAEEFEVTASDGEIATIYRQMGAALREIHGIRRDGFGYAVKAVDNLESANSTFMHGVFDKRATVYSELTGDHETVDAARAYVAEREALFDLCTTPVLLHGDFHDGNVIVDQRPPAPTLTGVVDLENAMSGDPVADMARLDTFSMHGSTVKQSAFFEGYGSLPAEWDARRLLYQLVQAFELWVWYHQDGHDEYLPEVVDSIRQILVSD